MAGKIFEFGAHFNYFNLKELLERFSDSIEYKEMLKETLIEEKNIKYKNNMKIKNLQLKNIMKFNNEFKKINKFEVRSSNKKKFNTFDCDLKYLKKNIKFTNKNLINNKINQSEKRENKILFPLIKSELKNISKSNLIIKLTKKISLNLSNKKKLPYELKNTMIEYHRKEKEYEKFKFIHNKTINSTISESIGKKLTLPIIKN